MSKVEEKEVDAILEYIEKSYDQARKQIEDESSGGGDERVLKLANGNTKVRVRILPPLPQFGILTPWVKKYIHTFNSVATDELLTLDCPWSLGLPCKICMNNKKLWDAGDDASRNLARRYRRKESYAVNVFVRDSATNAEDNGKVKVYRFPKKVYQKLKSAMDDIGAFYSPTEAGADFIINKTIVKTEEREFANYDQSMFVTGVPLAGSKTDMATILRQCHDLNDFGYKPNESDPMLKTAFETHVLGKRQVEKTIDPVADQKPSIKNARDEMQQTSESDDTPSEVLDEEALMEEIMADLHSSKDK